MSRKVSFAATILLFLLLSACSAKNENPSAQDQEGAVTLLPVAHQATHCPFETLFFDGEATNLTANASTGVTMQIRCSSGLLRATGQYDSKRLFGRFDIDGRFTKVCQPTSTLCMDFSGELLLGDDGSGFPSGTKAKYTMSIRYGANGSEGNYKVGLVPGYIRHPQYGTLKLHESHR